jgi:glycosyltransferase involved in cell wall biosynthesis
VFTNQFPGPVSTFFARDMRGLLEAGVEVDIFPVYPLDAALWRYVPDLLNDTILPRSRIHHLTLAQCLRPPRMWGHKNLLGFVRATFAVGSSAVKCGLGTFTKTAYVVLKAWTWAQQYSSYHDHVLAYWGNYSGDCAYLYHQFCGRKIPFSLFLHAKIDLYRNPIDIRNKLLYVDNIITCSDFNREFIASSFSDISDRILNKIYVHHHGLNFDELPMGLNHRLPGKIIAVGRFVEQKGFDYLLRAVHLLRSRGVPVQLELVGDGPQTPFLHSLARELNILDVVKFRGWLTADEVPGAISQAMILVHPSPDLGDGVPNVIKEAMAVGTPVIGSTVAGIPELLAQGDHGVLVPPKNLQALADAIEALLSNDELRHRYADRARKYAECKFNLWENGQRLAQFLVQPPI